MLTRIRIEAEGATTQAVQEDVFAAYDAMHAAFYGPAIIGSMRLEGEVYEQVPCPNPETPRWYRGRALVKFTNQDDGPFAMDAARIRPRVDFLNSNEGFHLEGPSQNSVGGAPVVGVPEGAFASYRKEG